MALAKVGNIAPAFTLLDQNGKKVSLKDFKDKKNVVLYFYPKAMTPGCTVQAQGIRDTKKEFCKKEAVDQEIFRSVKLYEADSLMRIGQISRLNIGKEQLKKVINELMQYEKNKSSSYPIVSIDIKEEKSGRQSIDLSYHYSKSTYHFCYEIIGLNYKPKWSSFKTFGRNDKTYYESENE